MSQDATAIVTPDVRNTTHTRKPRKWRVLSLTPGCGSEDLALLLAGIAATSGASAAESAFESKDAFLSSVPENPFKLMYACRKFPHYVQSKTYAKNLPGTADDPWDGPFPQSDIVIARFPEEDGIDRFIRCLEESRPRIFIAFCPKMFAVSRKGKNFQKVIRETKKVGYTIKSRCLNAADYGIPQLREHGILVGVRYGTGFKYTFPIPTYGSETKPYVTMRDAISDLYEDPGDYYDGTYSPVYMSRNRKKDWNQPSFAIQSSGRQMPMHPAGKPMKLAANGDFEFAGDINRRLSVKEAARLQTFPDWFDFVRVERWCLNATLESVYHQIGDAIPIRLAYKILLPIAQYAAGNIPENEIEAENGKKKKEIPCTLTAVLQDGSDLKDYQARLIGTKEGTFAVRTTAIPEGIEVLSIRASWCGRLNAPAAATGTPVHTIHAKNCTVYLCGKKNEQC